MLLLLLLYALTILVPALDKLLLNELHLLDVMLLHVVPGPLLEFSELASFHILSALAIHKDCLLVLHFV